MSYGPNRIDRIRRTPGSNLGRGVIPPGVDGPGELARSISFEVGRCWRVADRSGLE